jgi:hypothetical protein
MRSISSRSDTHFTGQRVAGVAKVVGVEVEQPDRPMALTHERLKFLFWGWVPSGR